MNFAKKVDLCSHHTYTHKRKPYEVIDMLISLITVISSQCTLKQQAVHHICTTSVCELHLNKARGKSNNWHINM